MNLIQPNGSDTDLFQSSPQILLSGDNARTATLLHDSLLQEGFRVQLAPGFQGLETVWEQQHQPLVLLEISGPQSVEDAVETALNLKRHDPGQFVGYLADPVLYASGLVGDAIFPRTPAQLSDALKRYLAEELG